MSSEGASSPGQKPPKPGLPQLKMQFRAFAALAPVRLPPGYTLATLAQRDAAEWIAVLNATGKLGTWDDKRARESLTGKRPVLAAGSYLILSAAGAVATACTLPPTAAEPRSELGWVAVDPAHQGRGLGLQV
jgi:ribosomal protein S18 acetylase RimI-like enzyme